MVLSPASNKTGSAFFHHTKADLNIASQSAVLRFSLLHARNGSVHSIW